MRRDIYDDDHEAFRRRVRQFVDKEIVPFADEREQAGIVDRELFLKAGEAGFLCMAAPEEYGGSGVDDYRFAAKFSEVFAAHARSRSRWDSASTATCCCPTSCAAPRSSAGVGSPAWFAAN